MTILELKRATHDPTSDMIVEILCDDCSTNSFRLQFPCSNYSLATQTARAILQSQSIEVPNQRIVPRFSYLSKECLDVCEICTRERIKAQIRKGIIDQEEAEAKEGYVA